MTLFGDLKLDLVQYVSKLLPETILAGHKWGNITIV